MEVKLDKRYPLEVDPVRAWQVLRDVKTVAGCMPGATLTEQVDATHYKGNVKVKVGPATAAFAGDIEVRALDEAGMRLELFGKGADRGGSSASMGLAARIEPGDSAASSVLAGQASVVVSGKFAQFGSRLMGQVSDMLLAQFVDNFRAAATASQPAATASTDAAPAAGSAPAPAAAEAASAPASAAPGEINALSMLWRLVKGWLAGLFGRRA
jgi:carbon monoxide dehydrogenase subunit G